MKINLIIYNNYNIQTGQWFNFDDIFMSENEKNEM